MVVTINLNPPLPSLPRVKDKKKINARYMLVSPFSGTYIHWDSKINELMYELEEPVLQDYEKAILGQIEDAMLELINVNVAIEKTIEATTEYIDKTARLLIEELNIKITKESYEKIFYYLFRDFIGLNEIDSLMRDYFIEDIECNGVNTPIYIVHRIYRNIRTNVIFKDVDSLASFVEKLAQRSGRYVSYAQPLLDGTLPDGSIDYNEPVIYRENGIVKINKIGQVVDKYYEKDQSNKPVTIEKLDVASFDKDTFKIKWKKANYVYRHKVTEDLYKLNLEFGRKVKLTGCHSIFVVDREGIKSKRTDELKEGDYVVLPSKFPENPVINEINLAKELANSSQREILLIRGVLDNIYNDKKGELYSYYREHYKCPNQAYHEHKNKKILPLALYGLLSEDELRKCFIGTTSSHKVPIFLSMNKELVRFIGFYIAEGWLHNYSVHGVTFCLHKDESEIINEIKESAKKCFNLKTYVAPPQRNGVKVVVDGIILWLIMKDVLKVKEGAKQKRVPEFIFNIKKELQTEFIKAWHEGDYSTTVSEELANDVSYLALFNQDIAAFYKSQPKKTFIRGREINSNGAYYSNFYARDVNRPYPSMIPIELFNPLNKTHYRLNNQRMWKERLLRILEEPRYKNFENLNGAPKKFILEWEKRGFIEKGMLTDKGKRLLEEVQLVKKLADSDFCFAKIKKISRVKPTGEYVYDFSVEGSENFVGGVGGICCHNSRINATYTKDVTSRGPTFSIRKFTETPWTPPQLIALGTISPEMMAYFWILIENKSNILVAGGTASGKTTLLNAISFFIPPESRVVSIEDSVTGDSKIIIKKDNKVKNITIKEFVDKEIDAEVMTLDEKGKIIWVKPSNYIKHKVKKDIYEVLTATGRKVKVTQDHSLFTLGKDNEMAEIKPYELKERESFIAVPRFLPIDGNEIRQINLMGYLEDFKDDFLQGEPIKNLLKKYNYGQFQVKKERYRWWKNHNLIKIEDFLKLKIEFTNEELEQLKIKSKNTSSVPVIFNITKEFLEFCGLWLGDGSYDNYNGNSVIISNVDKECIDIFKKIAEYLGVNYSAMSDGGVSLRLHSTVFYKFMKNVLKFDGYSDTKKIPEFIFGLSNEQIKHFIRGYFSADGCVKKKEVSCASQSFELLEDLQTLFLRLNLISIINDFDRKDKCINMSISSLENIDRYKEIGFLQERKNVILNSFKTKSHHACSDVIPLSIYKLQEFDKISNIKIQYPYLQGWQNMGREYMQKLAPTGSEFNDLSHNDILWDRVKKIKKVSSEEIEVFDLSIPKYEKFLCNNIIVHNTRELNLPRENWLPAVARNSIGIGKIGEVDLFSLLKNSFRQNPDYVIVGEVRGKEAFVLFQGMASGHSSLSTVHADSVDTLIRRLQTPPIELSPTLVNSLDCVAIASHVIVKNQESRRIREIVEIINVNRDGTALINTPFMWSPQDDRFYFKKQSKVFEKISARTGIPMVKLQQELSIRARLLYELYKRKVYGFDEVGKLINDYYKNPIEILNKYGIY